MCTPEEVLWGAIGAEEYRHVFQGLFNFSVIVFCLFYYFRLFLLFFFCFLSDSLCKRSLRIAYCFSNINAFFIIGHIQNQPESGRDACRVVVGIRMVSRKLSASLSLPGLSILLGRPPASSAGVPRRALC